MSADPRKVTVIDYDITLNCGREYPFTLRPDLGDTEAVDQDEIHLLFAKTRHQVDITRAQVAILSRREREIALPAEAYVPEEKRKAADERAN